MKAKRPAYTLLELVLVIALIGIVSAISYPIASTMYAHEKVKTAADAVRTGLADARSRAMSEGRAYKMAVIANKGRFRIAPDSPSYWSGSGSGDQGSGTTGEALVTTQRLPHGITFTVGGSASSSGGSGGDESDSGADDWGAWSDMATFQPDGTASEDRDITLEMSGARPVVLKVRAMTGAVTMEQ